MRGGRIREDRVKGEASSKGVLVLKGVLVSREGGTSSFPLISIKVIFLILS